MRGKLKWIFIGLLITLFNSIEGYSQFQQRVTLVDEEQVTEMVTKEIDETFKSADFLKKKNKKFAEVKGNVVVDIGVYQNGKVSSFFKVDSDIQNPNFINFISAYILEHKFNFKLQKQQRYKIRYNAIFE